MPRIEWSHDGSELLTCLDGTLRRGETIVDGPNILDARWRPDGSIVSIDTRDVPRLHGTESVALSDGSFRGATRATIAGDTDSYVAITPPDPDGVYAIGLYVSTFEGKRRWQLNHEHGVSLDQHASLAISNDAHLVAIGYENLAWANYTAARNQGRGWIVIDTRKDRVIDRSWVATQRQPHRLEIVFDQRGRRIAMATPETQPCIGAIRVGRDEVYPREHLGGARAVALDDKGILAAYAYPTSVAAAPRRLRVDYLESGAKGGSKLEILDTLWIDPTIDDIVALAFDRTSRRIACLGASGAIDIVPVP